MGEDIWPRSWGGRDMTRAERVLDQCTDRSIYCWNSHAGGLEIALFIEIHPDRRHIRPIDSARAKFACRSFHPEQVFFRHRIVSEGGEVEAHDSERKHRIMAGCTPTEPCRSCILPIGVGVSSGPDGAMVEAHFYFDRPDLHENEPPEILSVEFPQGSELRCPCC